MQPLLERLAARATVRHTPCGAGQMVWHGWQPEHAGPRYPPVVLLHGGSGSWTHWARNIEPLLATGRSVWAADLPGFGDSASPPAGSTSGADADALVEPLALGLCLLPVPACDLVGFSFGGLTAALLLAAHPALARRLVLVGAPALGLPVRRLRLLGWRHLPDAPAQNAAHHHNLRELMLRDADLIDAPLLALHAANVARDRMPRRRLSDTNILARMLPTLRCPVHAIYGAHDVLYADCLTQLAPALSAAPDFRGLELIDGAGHWVQFEQAAAFDAALCSALEAVPGPTLS